MAKKQKKFPKLIKDVPYEVEWTDTFEYNGWHTEAQIGEKIDKASVNLSIGYFVKEKNGFIVLVMGREIENEDFAPYNTPRFIPRGCIKSIRKL